MKLVLHGAGRMGEALARGVLRAGLLDAVDLTLVDVVTERAHALAAELGAVAAPDNRTAVTEASIVVIAVKPYDLPSLCAEIADALPAGCAVLSIAAGVTLNRIARLLHRNDLILARAMPNTPCLVGAGATGLSFAGEPPTEIRRTLHGLLSAVGLVEEVPEQQLNAVTGLSGSGPAYIAVLIEALADGGVQMGLPRAQAERLAMQTVRGTAQLLQETGQHPAQVKDAVSSPGGTTIAGLAALESEKFRYALIAAVRAATMRAHELSGE